MSILNVPNSLTIVRLLSLPAVILLSIKGRPFAAATVFLTAMATDAVDGCLAKKLRQETTFGLYLDPVVDKIVILTLLYELAARGLLPMTVAHLFLARELLQNGVRAVAAGKETIGANWMGKVKAVLQTGLIAWGLALGSAEAAGVHALRLCAAAVLALAWAFLAMFVFRNRHVVLGSNG